MKFSCVPCAGSGSVAAPQGAVCGIRALSTLGFPNEGAGKGHWPLEHSPLSHETILGRLYPEIPQQEHLAMSACKLFMNFCLSTYTDTIRHCIYTYIYIFICMERGTLTRTPTYLHGCVLPHLRSLPCNAGPQDKRDTGTATASRQITASSNEVTFNSSYILLGIYQKKR